MKVREEKKWNMPNPNLITFPTLNNFPPNFFILPLKHQRHTNAAHQRLLFARPLAATPTTIGSLTGEGC